MANQEDNLGRMGFFGEINGPGDQLWMELMQAAYRHVQLNGNRWPSEIILSESAYRLLQRREARTRDRRVSPDTIVPELDYGIAVACDPEQRATYVMK